MIASLNGQEAPMRAAGSKLPQELIDEQQQQQKELKGPLRRVHLSSAHRAASIANTEGELKLLEKSVIIHKDDIGFGLRIRGEAPVCVEHVHVGGAAWRAGVRRNDTICRVNGVPICNLEHKNVVLMLKSCARFVALTLLCPASSGSELGSQASAVRFHERQLANLRANEETLRRHSLATTDENCGDHGGEKNNCKEKQAGGEHQETASTKASGQQEKRLAVCICCRSALGERPPGRTTGATCARCQLAASELRTKVPLEQDAQRLLQPLRHGASLNERQPQQQGTTSAAGHHQRLATFSVSSKSAHSLPVQTKETLQQQHQSLAQRATQKPVRVNKRLEIIREFLETERAHTERLRCLDELFYRPLKAEKLMTGEQLKAVFSCHRKLFKLHRQIYRILLSATTAPSASTTNAISDLGGGGGGGDDDYHHYHEGLLWARTSPMHSGGAAMAPQAGGSPLIGSALIEVFDGELKRELERASCAFCSAQATNAELLNKLTRRDTKVGEFLAHVTSQRIVLGRLGIKDLLASCFQRLTKYPLLLENLLKATPSEAPPEQMVEDDQNLFATLERDLCDELDDDCALQNEENHNNNSKKESVSQLAASNQQKQSELRRLHAQQHRRNSRRMLTISLAEERQLIERSLRESRQILLKVNESIKVALARQKFRDIWRKTDKGPNLPPIDTSKQQVIHEGTLTLRLSRRSFDVHMLLLNDYIIILTRDGREDKFRLRYFTPEGKSLSSAVVAAAVAQPASASSQMAAAAAAALNGPQLQSLASLQGSSSASSGGPSSALGNPQAFGGGSNTPSSSNTTTGASASLSTTMTTSTSTSSTTSATTTSTTISSSGGFNPLSLASSVAPNNQVYSPIFHIDEHLTTRDAATDENGFYLLCKRRDDSRIYEFASRSPAERMKWRDLIQWTIERQIDRCQRRASCASSLTARSSIASADSSATTLGSERGKVAANCSLARRRTGSGPIEASLAEQEQTRHRKSMVQGAPNGTSANNKNKANDSALQGAKLGTNFTNSNRTNPGSSADGGGCGGSSGCGANSSRPSTPTTAGEPTRIVGTISYVIDDEIVMPSKMESSRVFVDQAIQVNILDGTNGSARQTTIKSTAPPPPSKVK